MILEEIGVTRDAVHIIKRRCMKYKENNILTIRGGYPLLKRKIF